MPTFSISSDMSKLKFRDQIQLKLDIINLVNNKINQLKNQLKSHKNPDNQKEKELIQELIEFKHTVLADGLIPTLVALNNKEIIGLINSKYQIFADPDCLQISHRDLSWYGMFDVVTHFYNDVLDKFDDCNAFFELIDELSLNFKLPSDYYEHTKNQYENGELSHLKKRLYEFIAHFDSSNEVSFTTNQAWWQKLFYQIRAN